MYNNPSYPLVIAHRGFSGIAPENTIAAIKLAMERGVDMIEIDVHQSKDGVPVVIHDKTIDRTTNGTGRVAAHTYSQLNSFDAGSWFDTAYKEEHIPSLEEVLELIAGTCKLLIEIKHGSSIYGEIEKKVIETVHLKNAQDWCILQSFEDEVLENLKNLNCPLETHKLITADVPIR
jgi:glycerophosphoryl diester phosphodiesterase